MIIVWPIGVLNRDIPLDLALSATQCVSAFLCIDREALALGNHLLVSSWFSYLMELQREPPNGRSDMHAQPDVGDGRNILHFGWFLGLFDLLDSLVE